MSHRTNKVPTIVTVLRRSIRRNCRHLERRFRRSYADVDRLAWTTAVRDKNKAFEKKKADYWKTRLADSGRDLRRFWQHANNVLCLG